MSKCIVTGVTGQAGSYFADFLLVGGHEVIGTCRRLSVPNTTNIKSFFNDPFFSMESMDLGDSHSIDSLILKHKPDYFINCAANSFVANSWICPEQHIDYNCNGVIRQLEAIRKHSPHTRYINFGSSEEFGDVAYSPQDEKHPARARSIYGVSKVAARQAIKVYRESYDLYALQCWCFNYESSRRGEEFVTRKITKNVGRIVNELSQGITPEPLQVGNVNSSRDWSHAKDIVNGVWLMLNQDKKKAKEYVFSSGLTHTIRSFIELAFGEVGIVGEWRGEGLEEEYILTNFQGLTRTPKIPLVVINPKFFRPAEVDLLHGDSSLARKELGWKPNISFKQLVSEMVNKDLV